MTEASREARVLAALVAMAGSLTEEYEVVDLLDRLTEEALELLEVDAAALVLENARGELELVASSNQQAGFVELVQLDAGDGPCIEAFRTGEPIVVPDVREEGPRWAEHRAAAEREGFRSVHAVPLRAGTRTIGSLGLFRTVPGALSEADARVARALADIGSIAILQERALRESEVVSEQLRRALDSRVAIEQAKGVVAESLGIDMDEAFRILRSHARSTNATLQDVARQVASRTLRLERDEARGGTSERTAV
ncbi:GAF and ANTAR domain-containing protein [Agrococcus terreus]|uniref:Transcriptional regulator n=1 Tax=Agrococcus terreus TaxID=574649 RepID=A0ABQ2KHG8_9MICO|nr:GAF and ANTAR domain-containing protein [Agrococcus terreus]GGN83630.1 transcriptional regulator [Agrococcus terreus]